MRPFMSRKVLLASLFTISLFASASVPIAIATAAKKAPKAHLTAVTSRGAPKHWILLKGTNLKDVRSVRYYEGKRFWTTKRFHTKATYKSLTAYFPKLPPTTHCGIRVVTKAGLSNAVTIEIVVQNKPGAPLSVPPSSGSNSPTTIIVVTTTTVVVVQPITSTTPPAPSLPQPKGAPKLPTLLVTSLSWKPPSPIAGAGVIFSAVVANVGSAPTPRGIGVSFSIDGTKVSWVDAGTNSPLKPGVSETLTANSGPNGSPSWTATAGTHSIIVNANYQLAFEEANYAGNVLSSTLVVSSPPPATTTTTSPPTTTTSPPTTTTSPPTTTTTVPSTVSTVMSIYQVDNSGGALGGEFKYFTVTLTPSVANASYHVGTLTLGCATVSGGVVDFEQIPLYHEPVVVSVNEGAASGAYTLPTIGGTAGFIFSHSSPTCGANPVGGPFTIYVQYSGGSENGITYMPDTFCAVPVVGEGFSPGEPTQTNVQTTTNTGGCPDTGPPTPSP